MEKKKILIVGSANMDLFINMYKMPEKGETLMDDGGVAYMPGGKSANSAVGFARLGSESILCAKVGKDLHGQKLYQYYKELGINTSYIKVDPDNPTGLAVVMRENDGANRIVVYPGANEHLSLDNIADAFSTNPDAVYLGFEIPFSTALACAKMAASRGIPVFVDAAPADKDYPLENLPEVEVFSPNETETLEYTGILPQGADSSLRAALALYRRVKCKYLVIKQGARGAFIYDGKHYFFVPSMRAGTVVDTTGAGDCFTAAMVHEYMRSKDIKGAVKYGIAASAIAVTRRGAAASMPTEAEVLQLLYSDQF